MAITDIQTFCSDALYVEGRAAFLELHFSRDSFTVSIVSLVIK